MRLSRNKKIILAFALMTLIGLVPFRAHAFDFLTFISSATGISASDSFGSALFHFILSVLTPIKTLLLSMITGLANVLNWVISLHANTGGQVVYAVWKVLRDLCNMAFIVVIIVTSFGTIFNVFKIGFLSFYNIYNPKLIRGFLMAAILINFSLAIGQSVVTLSNHVSDIVIGLFPANIGGQIALELQVGQTLTGDGIPRANVNPAPAAGTTTTTTQGAAAPTDEQKRTANKGWDNIFLGSYLNCVNENSGITNTSDTTQLTCYQYAAKNTSKIPYPEVATAQEKVYANAGGNPPPIIKVGGFLGTTIGGQNVLLNDLQKAQVVVAANLGKGDDTSTVAAQVMGTVYSIFMLMVLVVSFLAVVIFMLIRIPIMWVILALSPLAWVGLLTSDEGLWKDWWKQFMAWNYFTPLYLGMIYLGLYLLSQQPNLLASLTGSSAIDSQLGMLLFYLLVGIIFIGGTAGVVKVAFAGGTVAGNVFGGIAGRLGIDDKRQGAVGTVYRGLGLQNQVAGFTQRIQQSAGDLRANVSGRLGGIPGLRTQEEAIAAAQRRYGVRGGGKDYAAAVTKRVENQKAIITEPLNRRMQDLQNKLAQTTTEPERKAVENEIKKAQGEQEKSLRNLLTSGNRDAAMAAGDELLSKGKLSAEEIRKLGERYASASPEAAAGFIKRRDEQLIKEAGDRNFKGDPKRGITPAAEMQSFMDLIGDSKQAKKFYDAALKGKNKVAAIETGVARGLLTDRTGKRMTFDQALEDEAESFSDNDLLDADLHYKNTGGAMPNILSERLKTSMKRPEKFGKIIRNITDPDQQLRILDQYADIKKGSAQARLDIKGLQRRDRQYVESVKRLRQLRKKSAADPVKQARIDDIIGKAEDRRIDMKEKLNALRKTTTT